MQAIDDLLIDSTKLVKLGVAVYGDPIHASSDAIIAAYASQSLDDFLAHEARHGIGNYAVVVVTEHMLRIITSTAYCGGYLASDGSRTVAGTTLAGVLASSPVEVEFDPFALCLSLTSHPKSAFSQLPMSTVFTGIHRLPPASYVDIPRSGLPLLKSYLHMGRSLPAPASFEAAIMEVATALARRKSPVVMFSGGVDSLIIYLALREVMPAQGIRAITMQTANGRSLTNGHRRAYPVAKRIGAEIEILADRSQESPAIASEILRMMSRDMIGTRSPHLALAEYDISGDIIHGQNMDATVMNAMDAVQFNKELGYLSSDIFPRVDEEQERQQLKYFSGNLQFTMPYLTDLGFQQSTALTFAKWRGGVVDPDPGGEGVLRGLLSSQFPNVLPAPRRPGSFCNMIDGMNREVPLYKSFVSSVDLAPARIADTARYYTYSAIAAKRLSTFAPRSNGRVQLVAMAGPIVSYFIGKPKDLLASSQPKRELYELTERLGGAPYSELASNAGIGRHEISDPAPPADPNRDYILEQKTDVLSARRVLEFINDSRIRGHMANIYDETLKNLHPGSDNFSVGAQSRARLLLNLELILDQSGR